MIKYFLYQELIGDNVNEALSWINYDWFLETFFLHGSIFLMTAVFAVFFALIFLNKKTLFSSLKLNKKTAILLFLIFLAGFYLRNSEYHYGQPTDGYMYFESARFMLSEGFFVRGCAIGGVDECRLFEQPLFPPGYPFLIFIPSVFLGFNSLFAPVISGFLSSIAIILIFFAAKKLFKSNEAGLFSAAIFAFFPLELLFASTGNVRPTANFFMVLSLLFFIVALKQKKVLVSCLFTVTLLLTFYMHQQYIVLLIPIMAFIGFRERNWFKKPKNVLHPVTAILLFLILGLVLFYWVFLSGYRGPEGFIDLENFYSLSPRVLSELFWPFTQTNFYLQSFGFSFFMNPLVSVFLIASIFFIKKKGYRQELTFLWGIFTVFFLSTVLYSYCPGGDCLDYVRFLQPLTIPVALLAGFSCWKIFEFLRNLVKKKQGFKTEYFLAVLCVLLIVLGGFPLQASVFRDARTEKPGNEALYFKAVEVIPNQCTVINPHYLITLSDALPDNKRRTINPWVVFEFTIPFIEKEIMESECVYWIKSPHWTGHFDEGEKYFNQFDWVHVKSISEKRQRIEIFKLKG